MLNDSTLGPFQTFENTKRESTVQELLDADQSSTFIMPSIQCKFKPTNSLYTPIIDSCSLPVIIDSYSSALPPNAWEWQSTEIEVEKFRFIILQETFEIPSSIESKLILDPRGQTVYDLIITDINFARHMTLVRRLFYQRLLDLRILSDHSLNNIFFGTGTKFNSGTLCLLSFILQERVEHY